jgi:hypothetical protein
MPKINTLVYYKHSFMTVRSFITLVLGILMLDYFEQLLSTPVLPFICGAIGILPYGLIHTVLNVVAPNLNN